MPAAASGGVGVSVISEDGRVFCHASQVNLATPLETLLIISVETKAAMGRGDEYSAKSLLNRIPATPEDAQTVEEVFGTFREYCTRLLGCALTKRKTPS
jgi:hypothetical protein